LIRKFTSHLRYEGIDLLEKLFTQAHFSFEDFYKWFKITELSKEQKTINVNRMIGLLIKRSIIQYDKMNQIYDLHVNYAKNMVSLVNSGTIRFNLLSYYEEKILSPPYLYYFAIPSEPYVFYQTLLDLVKENLDQVNFWKKFDNQYGQVISYVRAKEYYENFSQLNLEIRPD